MLCSCHISNFKLAKKANNVKTTHIICGIADNLGIKHLGLRLFPPGLLFLMKYQIVLPSLLSEVLVNGEHMALCGKEVAGWMLVHKVVIVK